MKLSGEICTWCKSYLVPPFPGHERSCERCAPKRKVLMAFHSCHDGWSASFVNSDGKTPVGPIRGFRSDEALRLTIERGSALATSRRSTCWTLPSRKDGAPCGCISLLSSIRSSWFVGEGRRNQHANVSFGRPRMNHDSARRKANRRNPRAQ